MSEIKLELYVRVQLWLSMLVTIAFDICV